MAADARTFPFSAIVASEDLAIALILTTVSPEVGGVLVRGEKGTAKTTMVRGLAEVLPDVAVVEGCRFSCHPADPDSTCPDGPHLVPVATSRPARLVELPVGATEDRVIGALDLKEALGAGQVTYQPGLLAAAHRGILYVDEVNLLHDHLVDLLLDAAATGRSTVEREGVSVSHASRIVLIGTMNPEEGELRPQLLDRFGLTVQIAAPQDPTLRAEVIRRRMAYDADPEGFVDAYAVAQKELRSRILEARAILPLVRLADQQLIMIAEICAAFGVDGLRADIVTARAAAAHAAWEGRSEVITADIRAAARLALPHRRRRNPFDAPGLDEDLLDQLLDDHEPEPDPDPDPPDSARAPSLSKRPFATKSLRQTRARSRQALGPDQALRQARARCCSPGPPTGPGSSPPRASAAARPGGGAGRSPPPGAPWVRPPPVPNPARCTCRPPSGPRRRSRRSGAVPPRDGSG